ncbi:hypothetical protein L596_017535 [Steinernema carpocapsae]|uniref:Uncharacterized protein n=1 Tax=Steinernema carpocapsae TaxID=34508 RepID=A0A4U5N2N8_STECR|nr:hypothetical protein L596_017535 [Steinernema carpocapsae]
MSTATEIPVTTSTEAPTTKTTSKAATTTELETTRYTFQTTTKTGATSTFEKPAFWPWDTYRPLESEKKGKPVAETNTATVTPETVMGAMEISLLASLGSLLLVCIICTIIVVIFCMCFAEDMPPVVEQWDPEVNYAPSYTVIVSENAVEPAEQKNSVKCIPNDASSQAPSDTTISKAEIVQPAKTRKKKYPV